MASEIDRYARQAYEVVFGETPRGDVTQIPAKDVPDHDLLTAGFPCQAFSVAGKRGGFEDARGTLFFEVVRIADVKRPRVILLENVKGLIGHDKGRTLNTIVTALNECGYAVDFEVLNSKYFGVPQNRERIFIVGLREDIADIQPWNISKSRKDVVAKGKRRIAELHGVKTFNFGWPEQTEVTTRLRDVLETDVDERFYLSEEKTAKLVVQLEEREQVKGEPPLPLNLVPRGAESRGDDLAYCLKGAEGGSSKQHLLEGNPQMSDECHMLGLLDMKGNESIRRVYSPAGISPTVSTCQGGHREPKVAIEQFTQGDGISCCVDANYTKGTAPGEVGKGRRTHVVEYSRKTGVGKELDVAHTLNSSDWRGLNRNQTPNAVVETRPTYRIRKLTPRECFRLQGFPDAVHDAIEGAGISNSQRYKMAGNAVTVSIIEALGWRLLPYLTVEHVRESVL